MTTNDETYEEALKGADEPQEPQVPQEPQEPQDATTAVGSLPAERVLQPQEPKEQEPQEPKPKKKPAALEKVICPGGCGRYYTKHWLRMGKHVCERKPRKGARPFVVKTKQPEAKHQTAAGAAGQAG